MNEAEERLMFGDKSERKEKQVAGQVFDMESSCFNNNIYNSVCIKQGCQHGYACHHNNKRS